MSEKKKEALSVDVTFSWRIIYTNVVSVRLPPVSMWTLQSCQQAAVYYAVAFYHTVKSQQNHKSYI